MTPRPEDPGAFEVRDSSSPPPPDGCPYSSSSDDSAEVVVMVEVKPLSVRLPTNLLGRNPNDKFLTDQELKDWIWAQYREEIGKSLVISRPTNTCSASPEVQQQQQQQSTSTVSAPLLPPQLASSPASAPLASLRVSPFPRKQHQQQGVSLSIPIALPYDPRCMPEEDENSNTSDNKNNNNNNTTNQKSTDIQEELKLYKKRWELMDRVASATQNFLQNERSKVVYNCLLDGILELEESEYGFIGEVRKDEDGNTSIRLHATTTVDHASEASKQFFEQHGTNFSFTNLTTLIGSVYTTKAPVVSNNVKRDQVVGCPYGHPNIENFLGLPLYGKSTDDVIGILCIANKHGGYCQSDVNYVEPFTATGSNLIQAYWQLEQNHKVMDDLETKVKERTGKLELANKRLEAANEIVVQTAQQQLQMFACMSHEIRTPLNCIIGMSDLLQGTELTPMQNDNLKMITVSGNLLLNVVNDVLDFSKLATGNVEIDTKRSNLQETLNATVHSIDMKAQTRCLSLRTIYDATLPEYVHTDAHRLQQILFNLLGNAVKFSNQGGTIEFGVKVVASGWCSCIEEKCGSPDSPSKSRRMSRGSRMFGSNQSFSPYDQDYDIQSDETSFHNSDRCCPQIHQDAAKTHNDRNEPKHWLRLVVKDYGEGIKESEFENIFKPFRQESKYIERQHGGTGLGLAITAKLVKAMEGKISVNSQFGEWTEFAVHLPLREEPVKPKDLGQKLADVQVVLIDSDMSSYERLRDIFQECDISCLSLPYMSGISKKPFTSSRLVCLIHEDFYDHESYESLLHQYPRAKLVTFGPNYAAKDSPLHVRAPVTLLPCVLMNTLHSVLPEIASVVKHSSASDLDATAELNSCDISQLRVLVAEDNHINQKVMARMLDKLGVKEVIMVDNGQKAVDAAGNTGYYDVVLMDMQMPVMDGIQACRIIMGNQHRERSKSKIVFVSANVACEDEFASVGAWDSVSKPFKIDTIRACLQKVAGAKENETQFI